MLAIIPDELFNDKKNMEKVWKIVEDHMMTSMKKARSDPYGAMLGRIESLGEKRVADFLRDHKNGY